MTHSATVESLKEVFEDWADCLNTGRLDEYWAYYHEDAVIQDEDTPWNCTKADFIDHIDYHATGLGNGGLWEFFQWLPRETQFLVVGNTGLITGFSTFRGRTVDAGFRQRFMGFSLTFAFEDGKWTMLSWHQSTLAGRISGSSPA